MATGRFADALTGIGVTGVSGSADFFTVYDFSATEQKKIAASDVLKRLLSTADVSYLPTLAMSSIVPASDKFLIWDASLTKISVITASDLLNKTFAGVIAYGVPLTQNGVDPAADSILVFDNNASLWKNYSIGFILNYLRPWSTTDAPATPVAVTAATSGQRFTNRTRTALQVYNLPTATVGLHYAINRIANYAVRVVPFSGQNIGDGGTNKYLEITGRGQVDLECLTTGEWEVTGGSSLYSLEA